jgi:hypothetical protein
MIDTNKSQALFTACDAFLTDLSTHEEATLSGGGPFITTPGIIDGIIREGIIRKNLPTPPVIKPPIFYTYP